jgi:hypothetical protein
MSTIFEKFKICEAICFRSTTCVNNRDSKLTTVGAKSFLKLYRYRLRRQRRQIASVVNDTINKFATSVDNTVGQQRQNIR